MSDNTNGWHEYQRLVLAELKRLSDDAEKIHGILNTIRMDIATLKVKCGIWGLVGGAIPAAAFVIAALMKS